MQGIMSYKYCESIEGDAKKISILSVGALNGGGAALYESICNYVSAMVSLFVFTFGQSDHHSYIAYGGKPARPIIYKGSGIK